jgi:hypothetical protein
VNDPECVQTARGLFLPAAVLCEFIASIAIACAYAAARATAFAKNDRQSCGNTQEPPNISYGSIIT